MIQSRERVKTILANEKIQKIAKTLLSDLGYADSELSILLTNDEEIALLNEQYRGKSSPTDVLSFSQQEGDGPGGNLLGDVVISVDTLCRQALELEVSEEEEFLRLLVHGVLHLVGYEHEGVNAEEAEKMFKRQDELIEALITELK